MTITCSVVLAERVPLLTICAATWPFYSGNEIIAAPATRGRGVLRGGHGASLPQRQQEGKDRKSLLTDRSRNQYHAPFLKLKLGLTFRIDAGPAELALPCF